MTSPVIRELRDDELRHEARAFLGKHHSSLATPVPIEHIVETMGLDLIPVATMPVHRGIEGFLSSDLTSICYAPHLSGPGLKDRYHFMLAHEVGHLILHKPLYTGFRTDSEQPPAKSMGIVRGRRLSMILHDSRQRTTDRSCRW